MKLQILIMSALSMFFTCCEKDTNNSKDYFKDLKGTWNNTTSIDDTIIFQNETTLDRRVHHYSIILSADNMILQYTGKNKLLIESSKHKYYLNKSKDTLVIENLSQYYPNYAGNRFCKFLNK